MCVCVERCILIGTHLHCFTLDRVLAGRLVEEVNRRGNSSSSSILATMETCKQGDSLLNSSSGNRFHSSRLGIRLSSRPSSMPCNSSSSGSSSRYSLCG